MNKQELDRLRQLDVRIKEIVEEEGLLTTDILFEIVPSQRVLEGMSYMFPVNFSHWTFGRDYDRHRTIYEHTGGGIPYEQVWNFDMPKAFLVETNPFVLNVMILAHVYGHVDFFLANRYVRHGRSFSDIALEARAAADRFRHYEELHGKYEVERVIDAGMSIRWHQPPDTFSEEPTDEEAREYLIAQERIRLERLERKGVKSEFESSKKRQEEIIGIKERLRILASKTPPEPLYDILKYIIENSPKPLEPWRKDVLTVIRNQARCLAPNGITKLLNEGWATYWHVHIMRRLFKEELLTREEHGTFNYFHSRVTREGRINFNWYNLGPALFENVKERWDKGQFGREYEEETNPYKLAHWDTKVNLGRAKIFQVRADYTNRMAVEEFFTDQFIHERRLYIYSEESDSSTGSIDYVIVEKNPEVIRRLLKHSLSGQGTPEILVGDGNYEGSGKLLLIHRWTGSELDERYRDNTLKQIYRLWGRPVCLETFSDDSEILVTCEKGKKIEVKNK